MTPIAMQRQVVNPCWNCIDFEYAAVHEVGHILGLHHPNSIGTMDGFPVGNNSYSTVLAANSGMLAYDDPAVRHLLARHFGAR